MKYYVFASLALLLVVSFLRFSIGRMPEVCVINGTNASLDVKLQTTSGFEKAIKLSAHSKNFTRVKVDQDASLFIAWSNKEESHKSKTFGYVTPNYPSKHTFKILGEGQVEYSEGPGLSLCHN